MSIRSNDLLNIKRGDRLIADSLSFQVVDTDPGASFPTAVIEGETGRRWTIYVNADNDVVDLEHGEKILPLCQSRAHVVHQKNQSVP